MAILLPRSPSKQLVTDDCTILQFPFPAVEAVTLRCKNLSSAIRDEDIQASEDFAGKQRAFVLPSGEFAQTLSS